MKHLGALVLAALLAPLTLLHAVTVEDLRCECRENPLGMDVVKPRLSWRMENPKSDIPRGQKQTAYQVLVASSPELLAKDQGDLWDSGKVVSDQSIQVEYAGKPLKSRMACCWRVRVTMLSGVCRFFYDSIAGIQEPNFYGTREFEPGYGVIRIKPHVLGDLTHASASIKTIRGIVSSDWKKTGNSLVLNVTIPVNASGRVSVPSLGLKNATLTVGGKVVWKDGAYVKGAAGITTGKQEPLMIGDSITQCMDVDGVGAKVWKEFFVPRKAINLGFGGDRTQHVLWCLEQMPKLKKAPKGAVLLIGTNNVCWGSDTPRNAAAGIQAVTRKLQALFPKTKILVLAVFPRRNEPDHKFRKQINEINSYLPELLKDMKNVTLLDIGPKFLDDKGFLLKGVMPDTTHPSEKGCEIWAEAIAPELKKMLGE
jgi:beta-glucosidase